MVPSLHAGIISGKLAGACCNPFRSNAMVAYSPPFALTHAMLSRENRNCTIQASLAIGR